MTEPTLSTVLRATTERIISDIDNFKHNPRALFEPTIEELLARTAPPTTPPLPDFHTDACAEAHRQIQREEILSQRAAADMPVSAFVPYCEICDQDQTEVPGMVLGIFRGGTICTDCLALPGNPVEEAYREQLDVWCERYLPITRCPWCHQLTRTAQDPHGPDWGCARCMRARLPGQLIK